MIAAGTANLFADWPTLETPRLLLRKVTPADAADVLEYASDPEVARYTSWDHHEGIDDAHRYIHWCLDRYQRHAEAPWGIEHRRDRKLIGTIGFSDHSPPNHRAEISYAISAKYWGLGLTPEALEKAIAHGFGVLGLNRIEAKCMPANVASARVMEKVGLVREGTLRQHLAAKGAYHDLHVFAILKGEWAAAQSGGRP